MALKDNYRMMKELVKLAFDGPRKITRKYWTQETYLSTIVQWSKRLEDRIADLKKRATAKGETFELPAILYKYSIQMMGGMPYGTITRAFLMEAVDSLRNAMHGRLRVEMRLMLSGVKDHREELRLAGEIGKLIRALSDKPRKYLDLSYIHDKAKGYEVEPSAIHNRIKEFFRDDWYANPQGLDLSAEAICGRKF